MSWLDNTVGSSRVDDSEILRLQVSLPIKLQLRTKERNEVGSSTRSLSLGALSFRFAEAETR